MRNPATMPWQDRIVEASDKLDLIGGNKLRDREAHHSFNTRKEIFAQAQIPGTIAMLEGGGAKPLHVLIETENGWLVRVKMSGAEAHALAQLLVASVRSG